jgi:hypothetical protein
MAFSWLERGLAAGAIGIFIKMSQGDIQPAGTRASLLIRLLARRQTTCALARHADEQRDFD